MQELRISQKAVSSKAVPKPREITNLVAALETYEQALTFLNAEIGTADEYIYPLYTAKVSSWLTLRLRY